MITFFRNYVSFWVAMENTCADVIQLRAITLTLQHKKKSFAIIIFHTFFKK